MRGLLFMMAIAACSPSSKASGPAWPKMAETDPKDDGGESIAPRESNAVATVIEKSEEPDAKKTESKTDEAPAAAAADDKSPPATTPPPPATTPSDDEVIETEEVIIEIDDDE